MLLYVASGTDLEIGNAAHGSIASALRVVSRFSLLAIVPPVMAPTKPTIIELGMDRLDEILRHVDAKELDTEDYATIRRVLESYAYLTNLVGSKNTTIGRLRKMLFGAKTEKTAAVVSKEAESGSPRHLLTSMLRRTRPTPRPRKPPCKSARSQPVPRKIRGRRARATAATAPTRTRAPRRSRSPTNPCKRAIPAHNANRARSTIPVPGCWCG